MPSHKTKLTKRLLDAAEAEAKDYEIRDTELTGFFVRVTTKGRKVYRVAARGKDGRKRVVIIGEHGVLTVDQAREAARQALAAIKAGQDPSAEKKALRKAPTVSELAKRYVSEDVKIRNRPSTVRQKERMIDTKILPVFGKTRVADVTRQSVRDWHSGMAEKRAEANNCLRTFRHMMSFAEEIGWRIEGQNPCKKVKEFKIEGRQRIFSDEEVARIFRALDLADQQQSEASQCIDAIRLLFALCGRASEICKLEWRWIDFDRKLIQWPDTKSGQQRKILSPDAVNLLDGIKERTKSEYVCPAIRDEKKPLPHSTLEKAFQRILDAASVSEGTLHTIRHTVATDVANDPNVALQTAMHITGHKNMGTLLGYIHDDGQRTADALSRKDQRMRERLAKAGGNVIPLPARQG